MSSNIDNGLNLKYLIDDAYEYFQYWISNHIEKTNKEFDFLEKVWDEDYSNFSFETYPKHKQYDNNIERLKEIDKFEFMSLMLNEVVIRVIINETTRRYYQFGDLDDNFYEVN